MLHVGEPLPVWGPDGDESVTGRTDRAAIVPAGYPGNGVELRASCAGCDGAFRGRLAAEHAVAGRSEAANQPVRLDGIVHPRSRPAVRHAGFNGLPRYFPAVPVEKRQLAPGLRQSPLEVAPLRLARPYAGYKGTGQIRTG